MNPSSIPSSRPGRRRPLSGKWWLVAPVVGVLALVGISASPVFATPATNTSTILAQATMRPVQITASGLTATNRKWSAIISTKGLTDGYVVENDFQPGQSTGWHSHPGPSIVFVVSGTVTNYVNTRPHCRGKSYTAGQYFLDAGGADIHEIVDTGTDPAKLIAVQFIPTGQLRRIDENERADCHVDG